MLRRRFIVLLRSALETSISSSSSLLRLLERDSEPELLVALLSRLVCLVVLDEERLTLPPKSLWVESSRGGIIGKEASAHHGQSGVRVSQPSSFNR